MIGGGTPKSGRHRRGASVDKVEETVDDLVSQLRNPHLTDKQVTLIERKLEILRSQQDED